MSDYDTKRERLIDRQLEDTEALLHRLRRRERLTEDEIDTMLHNIDRARRYVRND